MSSAASGEAWASAALLLGVHIFLRLVPDAPNGVCQIASVATEVEQLEARGIKVVIGEVPAPLWGTPSGKAGDPGKTEEPNLSLLSHS